MYAYHCPFSCFSVISSDQLVERDEFVRYPSVPDDWSMTGQLRPAVLCELSAIIGLLRVDSAVATYQIHKACIALSSVKSALDDWRALLGIPLGGRPKTLNLALVALDRIHSAVVSKVGIYFSNHLPLSARDDDPRDNIYRSVLQFKSKCPSLIAVTMLLDIHAIDYADGYLPPDEAESGACTQSFPSVFTLGAIDNAQRTFCLGIIAAHKSEIDAGKVAVFEDSEGGNRKLTYFIRALEFVDSEPRLLAVIILAPGRVRQDVEAARALLDNMASEFTWPLIK